MKTNKFVLIAFLSVFLFSTIASAHTVSIQVVGDGESIEGASVLVYGDSEVPIATGVTSSSGVYDTSLDNGNYVIKVCSEGYHSTDQMVTINGPTSIIVELISEDSVMFFISALFAIILVICILFAFRDKIFK